MSCRILRGLAATAAIGACADASVEPAPIEAAPAVTTSAAPHRDERSVFITYGAAAPEGRAAAIRKLGARSAHDVAEERTIAAVMPLAATHGLRRIPWVDSIEVATGEPIRVSADLITWGIDSTGAALVHASPGYRGANVRIGVLDTRVACAHGDLRDRIAGGYDFVDGTPEVCVGEYFGFPWHGTAVAGIIAGSRNGSGIVGVAPEASIFALRVCDDAGDCHAANIWAGLLWARKAGMQVVNLSLGNCGGELDWRIADGIRKLYESKAVIVASAGNGPPSCSPGSPVSSVARAPGVIGVSHWLRDGTQNPSYQYGPGIDLAAPVEVPLAAPGYGVNTNLHQGTSFAAPHVAGAAALLLQAGFSGADLVQRRLLETARDRGTAGIDEHWGAGTLDIQRAAVPRPFITGFDGADAIGDAGSYSISAAIANGAPPFSVAWAVTYSDSRIHASYAVTGSETHTLEVPPGRYTITIKATPREVIYGRSGVASVLTIPVCTAPGGGGPVASLGSSETSSPRAVVQAAAC